ncbi:MAG: hypothetical protein WBL91_02685, partial [Pseudolabrys sp.]
AQFAKRTTDDALLRKNFILSHTAPFESESGNRKKKQLVLATHFDSLPDNSRASPDVCFVTNLRFPHHTTLRLVHAAPAAHLSFTKLPAALIGSSKPQHDTGSASGQKRH